jgi:predicted double-glycine peptidase
MRASLRTTDVIGVALLPLVLFGTAGGEQKVVRPREDSCGPLALRTCLALLSQEVDAGTCADLAGTDEKGTTTMAGLVKASRQLGRKVLSLHLKAKDLALLDWPAILHTSYPNAPEHFSVFAGVRDGRHMLINPTLDTAREMLSEEQLSAVWDGRCILFLRHPFGDKAKVVLLRGGRYAAVVFGLLIGYCAAVGIGKKQGIGTRAGSELRTWLLTGGALVLMTSGAGIQAAFADLSFLKPRQSLLLGMDVLDTGDLPLGAPVLHDSWLTNAGREVLKIDNKRIRNSCACLQVRTGKEVLAPGEKGVLTLRLAPRNRLGQFEYMAHVAADRPGEGRILEVRGNVVGPGATCPPRLYFGRVRPGQTLTRTFVYVARYSNGRVLRLESDSPLVEARILSSKSGTAEIGVSLVEWPGPGEFRGRIRLVVADLEEREIEIPFEGTLVQDS